MLAIPYLTSIRTRLIISILAVQAVVAAVLLASVNNAWSDMLVKVTDARVAETSRLLNAALAPIMAGSDPAAAEELLDGVRAPDGVDYLVLYDHNDKLVAARGWDVDAGLPVPPPDDIHSVLHGSAIPAILHASTPIQMGNKRYGQLRFGISTQPLHDAANRLAAENYTVLIIGVLVTTAVLVALTFWLTHRLYALIDATAENARRSAPAPIDLKGDDEIAELARHFNQMSAALQERVDALKQKEARFLAIANYTYGVELWLDPDGRLIWVNESVTRLFGYTLKECQDMPDFPVPLAAVEERGKLQDVVKQMQTGTAGQDFEFRAIRRDGRAFWAAMSWQPIYDAQATNLGIRASIHDNSQFKEDRLALKRAVYELQQAQTLNQTYMTRGEAERARLTALLAAMRFGVLFVDINNIVVFHNPAFKVLWLIDDSAPVIGKPIGQVLQAALNRPANYDIATHLETSDSIGALDVYPGDLTMNDGRIVTQHCHIVRDDHGQVSGRMWIFEDVTQEHFINERMVFLAERDALTGLYNRHAFQEQLESMLADAERSHDTLAALYFDLDEFKYVNDTFGHGAGDDLLKRVAEEVSAHVRRNEFFARLGGDEFAILVPSCTETEVSYLANRIVSTVAGIAFAVEGQNLRLSSSLGVAIYPTHAENAEDLIAHADTAMYQAKSAGKATWRLYKAERDASREMVNRLTWNERIQQALECDGFVMHFQGIYDALTREVVHLEALVRMKDANNPGQIIPPGHFIPHAERSGRILDIDRWVIRECVRLLADNPTMPPLAVNISGRSFDETSLPDFISELLNTLHVEPSRLMVELTETAAVSDMRDAQRFIDSLRSTGCTVCLDDFGAGFSSFAYLKHLKAQVLKIDGLFIRDLPNDHESQIFVKGMAAIARDMGKQTVAEFVENEETLRMLVEFGVDMVQGYYLDKPQPDHPALHRAMASQTTH